MFEANFGPYVLDTNGTVRKGEIKVAYLTTFESIILWCLTKTPGEVVHRDEIFKSMYVDRAPPSSNGIEVFVRRIRRKLDPDGSQRLIATVRGKGYKLRNDWPAETVEQVAA